MYTIVERVGSSRTDTNGIMRLSGAIDVIQDCSLLWMESEPSVRAFFEANNMRMFIASRQIDIIRLPVHGENIAVQTRVYECRRSFGYRNTVMYGGDGRPCVMTWCIGAFVNMETGKMARLPQEEIDRVTIDEKFDMEYLDKKISLPGIPARSLNAFPVRRSDIDLNHHMNNAKYIEAAMEFLPEDFAVRRLRIEYKAPAKLGELLYPLLVEGPDGKWYVLLTDSQNAPFTVMEFS